MRPGQYANILVGFSNVLSLHFERLLLNKSTSWVCWFTGLFFPLLKGPTLDPLALACLFNEFLIFVTTLDVNKGSNNCLFTI